MLKKKLPKKILSLLMSVLMVLTSCLVGIPSLVALKAEAAVTKETSTIPTNLAFYVPEAIYLYPNVQSWTATTKTPFQYFVQNTVNTSSIYTQPTTNTTAATTGNIYFAYDDASSVSLSFRYLDTSGNAIPTSGTNYAGSASYMTVGGSTLYSTTYSSSSAKTLTKTSNYYSTTISSGSSYSPYLAASTTGCYIEWTAKYVDSVDGKTKTAVAYTYVYKPYVVPVGGFVRTVNTNYNNSYAQQMTWISGVHSISVGTLHDDGGYYPNYCTSSNGKGLAAFLSNASTGYIGTTAVTGTKTQPTGYTESNGATQMYAVFATTDSSTAYFRANQSGSGISNDNVRGWGSTSSSSSTFNVRSMDYYYKEKSDSNLLSILTSGASGNIYIDSSRYSDLSQIPNLGIGLMVTDDEQSDSDSGSWYIADYTNQTRREVDYWTGSDKRGTIWGEYDKIIARQGGSSQSSMGAYETEGIKYAGAFPRAIDTSSSTTAVSTKRYSVKGYYGNNDGGDHALTHCIVDLNATQYNKSALRTAVFNAQKYFAKFGITDNSFSSLYYDTTSSAWTTFVSAYKNACLALTKVDGSITNPDTLATTLNNAVSDLVALNGIKTGTAKQYNVGLIANDDGTYTITALEGVQNYSVAYNYGENITITPESYSFATYQGSVKVSADPAYSTLVANTSLSALPTWFSSSSKTNSTLTVSSGTTTIAATTTTAATTPLTFSGNDILYKRAIDSSFYFVHFYLLNKYTVTFQNYNGTVLKTQQVSYGCAASAPSNPTRAYDATYHYTFKAWDKSFSSIKEDTTVTATFTATAHSYTKSVAKDSTCTAVGTSKYTCTCGYSYTKDDIAAKGHDWTATTKYVATAGTCMVDTVYYYECSRCNISSESVTGATWTDTGSHSNIAHTPKTISAVAATCTTAGQTSGTVCSVCGTIIKAPTIIPATGHTEVSANNGVAATCTTAGKESDTKCSVCGVTLTTGATIPA
ncbi:MAG: hypothetical protein ACI4W6_08990, partial [Acutalibacteraceae bacterium]